MRGVDARNFENIILFHHFVVLPRFLARDINCIYYVDDDDDALS